MTERPAHAAAGAILRVLRDGLEADQSALHFIFSTHGDASAASILELLKDRDAPDAATLAGLLLFPGEKVFARLEPVLERAACSPDDAAEAARIVEVEARAARVQLPGGESLEVALEPGDAAAFVARLRLDANPPRELASIIDERFPADAAIRLNILLRHCRLDFSPARRAFLAALLAGLDAGQTLGAGTAGGAAGQRRNEDATCGAVGQRLDARTAGGATPAAVAFETASGETSAPPTSVNAKAADSASEPAGPQAHAVLAWALSWLSALPPDAAPLDRLGGKYHELSARLKRALDFHEMLSKSSFEVLLSQGVREPCLHPESIRGELALLNTVSLAVAGRPAWTLAGLMEDDLGAMSDPEDVIRALGGV